MAIPDACTSACVWDDSFQVACVTWAGPERRREEGDQESVTAATITPPEIAILWLAQASS